MNVLFDALGRFTVRFRWVIVAVWVVGTVTSVHFLPSLASQVNNNNSSFLPASAPSTIAGNLAEPLIGKSNLLPIIVIGSRQDTSLTAADAESFARLAAASKHVKNVESVQYVGLSADGHAAQLLVEANVSGVSPTPSVDVVNGLTAAFAKAGPPPGLQFHLAGSVATNVAEQQQSKTASNRTQLLTILFIIVLLLFVFRSVLAPIITLIPAAVVLQLSGAIIGELGSHGLKISEVTQILLIVLILGAGTDYGLFLVFRVREGIRSGMPANDAVARAVSRVGESISASAGTVILALLTLLFASFGIYHDLGIPLAIGIAVMLVAGLTLLPALLAIFGRVAFWPAKIVAGEPQESWWGKVAQRVVARPAATLLIGLLVFGALALGSLFYAPAGFGGATSAPSGSDAAAGNTALAKYFPQSSANPTNLIFRLAAPVWKDPAAVISAGKELQASGLFTNISGPLNPAGTAIPPATYAQLHRTLGNPKLLAPVPPAGSPAAKVPVGLYDSYRATARFVSPGGTTVQFETGLTAGDAGSTPALNAVPAMRRAVTAVQQSIGAKASGVAGQAPALYDVSSISDRDLLRIVPIAIIAIGLLLALVLRSLVAPLYLIASVLISYLAALGLASILFIKLGGSGGLTFLLPFLMFIFLLALGEDYNILVMTRIREEAHHYKLRDAVVRAVGASGPTITSAGLVLAGTFLVLAVTGGSESGGSQIRDIGFGLALGILMDTFLVRSLLVPSTVSLLGRWNWWPGKLTELDHDDENAAGPQGPLAVVSAPSAPASDGDGGPAAVKSPASRGPAGPPA